jgi:hypothetical protein
VREGSAWFVYIIGGMAERETEIEMGAAEAGAPRGPGPGAAAAAPGASGAAADVAPGAAAGAPQPIRFFGTTWVRHDGGYGWRRVGVAAGALVAAALGAALLGLGVQGVLAATSGPAMPFLAVGGVTVCTVLGFHHTWRSFVRRAAGSDPEGAKGLYAVGFVGVLLAYFARALVEAPGERLRRAEYEAARSR